MTSKTHKSASGGKKSIRVRFAPSPTGSLHIGGLRSALYNWLFARHHHGTFILRIEDTDRARYVEGSVENLCRALQAVGLTPDEGIRLENGKIVDKGPYAPYLQSARRDKHLAYAKELIEKNHAYYCFCSKERLTELTAQQQLLKQPTMYDRHCRSLSKNDVKKKLDAGEAHVIRLAVPLEGTAVCEDIIRGRVEIQWAQVDDTVLIKSDGFPTYHLAATCDDHDMEISHVIRGEDWLSSLPKHLFIYQSLGWEPPQFAHLPLLLNPDRSKLSKRQGDVAAEDYLKKGYLPDALINFLALLGWNPTGDREIFDRQELIDLFDLAKVNKAGAIFNTEKLDWLNAHYLKSMDQGDYLALCRDRFLLTKEEHKEVETASADLVDRACLLVRDRIQTLGELPELTGFLFKPTLGHDPKMIPWKKQTAKEAKEKLTAIRDLLEERPEDGFMVIADVEKDLRDWIAVKKWENGETLWPLRVALSGQSKSPGPFELLVAYGKERSLRRIDEALSHLS